MKVFLTLSALLLAAPQAATRSVEVCPTLPADSNAQWTYSEGPDFDVCYAHEPSSDEIVFGIYLGNHPSFHPKRADRIGKGRVGGIRVVWYKRDPDDTNAAFSRQTLLTLGPEMGYMAHLWVAADTEQHLHDRLSVLERIRFKSP